MSQVLGRLLHGSLGSDLRRCKVRHAGVVVRESCGGKGRLEEALGVLSTVLLRLLWSSTRGSVALRVVRRPRGGSRRSRSHSGQRGVAVGGGGGSDRGGSWWMRGRRWLGIGAAVYGALGAGQSRHIRRCGGDIAIGGSRTGLGVFLGLGRMAAVAVWQGRSPQLRPAGDGRGIHREPVAVSVTVPRQRAVMQDDHSERHARPRAHLGIGIGVEGNDGGRGMETSRGRSSTTLRTVSLANTSMQRRSSS